MDEEQHSESLLRPIDMKTNLSHEGDTNASVDVGLDADATECELTLGCLAHLCDRYVAPVVVIAGLVGNLIALIVLSERSLQRRSSNVYLVAISAAGLGYLGCVMLSWTAHTSVDVYKLDGACQALTYITHVSSFLAVWYVVGFTVERYVVVHYPLRRRLLCTTTNARRVVVSLAAFAALMYSYGAWTSGVSELWPGSGFMCGPLQRYAAVLWIIYAVDTAVTLLLPFVVISLLNVRIAAAVLKYGRTRQTITTRSSGVALSMSHGTDPDRRRRRHYVHEPQALRRLTYLQFRVTKVLLSVSAAFLALNFPRHAARTYNLVVSAADLYRPSRTFVAWERIFNVVYYAHFAVNIVLYATIGGSNFRSALRRRCGCLCRHAPNVELRCRMRRRRRRQSDGGEYRGNGMMDYPQLSAGTDRNQLAVAAAVELERSLHPENVADVSLVT